MLGSSTRIMLLLLVCTGLLADSKYKVLALRYREFLLRKTQGDNAEDQPNEIATLRSSSFHVRHNQKDQVMRSENQRILKEVNENKVKAQRKKQGQKNKLKDSFQSSKRRVRRGSDPIHNKAQPFS